MKTDWKERDLDVQVAMRVMGRKVVKAKKLDLGWKKNAWPASWFIVAGIKPDDPMLADTAKDGRAQWVPYYSTSLSSAWEIIRHLSKRFHAVLKTPFEKGGKFVCGFTPLGVSGWNGRPDFQAAEKTMEIAICKAALLTVGKKKHEVG